jgi:hypothetical protein
MQGMLRIAVRGAVAVAILTAALAASAADEYTVQMKGANGPVTIYVSRSAVRRVEPGFKVDVIYRLSEGRIIYLDDEKKTYSEVTLAEARQQGTQAAAGMSPQQKAMMEKMGVNAAPTFAKLGPGETIAGHPTEKYAAKTPAMQTEIEAAPDLAVPPGYYDMARASAGALGSAMQSGEALKAVNGMILKRVGTMAMNGVTVTEVASSVSTAPIARSTFEPPPAYKKVPKEY